MSRIPDFSTLAFAQAAMPAPPLGEEALCEQTWLTPEEIPVKPIYGAADIADIDFVDSYPGLAPSCAGPIPPCM